MIAYTAVGLPHPSLGETLEIITGQRGISTQIGQTDGNGDGEGQGKGDGEDEEG
jgi:hypothetical protein